MWHTCDTLSLKTQRCISCASTPSHSEVECCISRFLIKRFLNSSDIPRSKQCRGSRLNKKYTFSEETYNAFSLPPIKPKYLQAKYHPIAPNISHVLLPYLSQYYFLHTTSFTFNFLLFSQISLCCCQVSPYCTLHTVNLFTTQKAQKRRVLGRLPIINAVWIIYLFSSALSEQHHTIASIKLQYETNDLFDWKPLFRHL